MKVSTKWLGEYLDLSGISAQELADKITRSGIEIDGIRQPGASLTKLVVGEVLSCDPMEGSDHLKITQVHTGEEEPVQIVCGAPNIATGQKVIVAQPGARLPGGKIKRGKIRGTVSEGMICSLQELGYEESVVPKKAVDGIYVLPKETEAGADVLSVLSMDDHILELDLTPNRADALSMRGVAYETGAILDQKPKFEEVRLEEDGSDLIGEYVTVKTENETDCPVYKMKVIKNVQVKESPLWMQTKLMNSGIRPADLVVDTTNYIMLKYGQPLHGFDYDKLGSKEIVVRRAHSGETMETLDGQSRELASENLVITNGSEPVALAGVMGGLNSHITAETTTVALEAAVFSPELVRKAARRLNLRSESSGRFEKGINWATVQEALDEAAALIAELGGGTIVSGTATSGNLNVSDTKVAITLSKINRSLGTDLSIEEVEEVFNRLQFTIELQEDCFTVSVPPRRWDVSIEADLLEEVARIYGYDRLPSTLPVSESTPGVLSEKLRLLRHTERFLEGCGLSESISYALMTETKSRRFSLNEAHQVSIDWPMSKDRQTLRMNLTSGLLEAAAYNQARNQSNVALYEFGRVFYGSESNKLPLEKEHLAAVLTGNQTNSAWNTQTTSVDFFTLKGMLESLVATFGLKETLHFIPETNMADMHPGRTARLELEGKTIGFIGQLHPLAAKEYDLTEVYLFELDFDQMVDAEKEETVFETIPRYPGSSRDIAFAVDQTVSHADILSVIQKNGGKWLRDIHLFDIYTGESIGEGRKSVAYSLYFLDPKATLVEETIQKSFYKIKQALEENFQAEIR